MTKQRFLFYAAGILILTLGIALTIQSQMGASPFDALLVGLYKTFGLTIGSWEIVVGLAMVLCNAYAQRQRPEYFALLTSLITGVSIDFWLFVMGDWIRPETIFAQIVVLGLGTILGGMGIAINLQANFAPNPMDRSMLVVRELTGWNVAASRAVISLILVFLALLFHGPIGIGTIVNALCTGAIIKLFMPYVARFEQRYFKRSEGMPSQETGV